MFSLIPFPDGIEILGRPGISTYSILLIIAFLVGSYVVPRELRRRGLDPEVADWSLLIAVIGAIVGSKVFYMLEIFPLWWVSDGSFGATFERVFFTWEGMRGEMTARGPAVPFWDTLFSGGGLVFYGGFIVAFSGIYIYLRRNNLPIWRYGDAFMLALAFGYGIGRLGCMVSGDGCFGHGSGGTSLPLLTMTYGPETGCPNDPALAWKYPFVCTNGVEVWNTPVMESIASFGLAAFLMLWARYQHFRPGMIVAIWLVFNGFIRFMVEFLRLNDAVIPVLEMPAVNPAEIGNPRSASFYENWHWYGFTQAQIVGVGLIIVGTAWMLLGKLYKRDDAGDPADA